MEVKMQYRKLWQVILILALVLVAVQPGLAAGQPDPMAPLVASGSAAIPNRFIVVFDESASQADVDAAMEMTARVPGVTIHFRYDAALKGFAATLPNAALNRLRSQRGVAYVEEDSVMTISTTQSPATWGLDRIDQRNRPLSNSYTYTATGSGVTAYIIDTGIRITHNDFGGRASVGTDTVGDGRNGDDCNGHGTHVAGTVGGSTYGVAKAVTLKAVRVLNCSGSGTTSGVIAGINWVTGNHAAGQPAVANMSLGGGASSSLDTAVNNSIADGIVYAVAAGNDRRDACRNSPARVPNALTVGATTSSDAKASYSNYGACLDMFAPGSSITSAWNTSNTATNTISGTSMATPHVAGVAALYLQLNPSAAPAAVSAALIANTTTGVVSSAGRNSPNRLLFSDY
jgi:subtilisin family serine protease